MKKNTAARTVTTFTVDLALDQLGPEDMTELSKPYVWKDEAQARRSVELMQGYGDVYRVVEHEAPGLTVFAIYRQAHRNAEATVLMSVIVFEDDTATRLHKAVRKQQPVTVSYVKADGEETVRTIEPTGLQLTKSGDVIVKALDRKSDEHRSFRLDRVLAYTVHRTRFLVRTPAPAPSKAELVRASQAPEHIKVVTDVYSTVPGTAAALEAPEDVQDLIAERYALGHLFAFVTV